MWRAPNRPRNEISQSYSDGIVTIYAVTDGAEPGYKPRPVLAAKATLRFAELRLGLQRLRSAAQTNIDVRHELRVPQPPAEISTQDVAVIRGSATQYKINLVQTVPDVWPKSLDLELVTVEQILPIAEGGEADG